MGLRQLNYTWLYAILTAAVTVAVQMAPDGPSAGDLQLDKPGELVLGHVKDLAVQVSALTATMLVASSALAINGTDWNRKWRHADSVMLILVFVLGATSFFGAYAATTAAVEMTAQGYVDLYQTRLQFALSLQYYSLLAGVALLGLVLVRVMQARVEGLFEAEQNRMKDAP